MITIETVDEGNFELVLPLIAAYQTFYKTDPDHSRNRLFFSQFIHDHSKGILFIALDEGGKALGFATLYFTFSSVTAEPLCNLNDLYVVAEAQAIGIRTIGHKLISHGFFYAVNHGYYKVYGTTDETNFAAQRLYNSLIARYKEYNIKKSVIIEYCARFHKMTEVDL